MLKTGDTHVYDSNTKLFEAGQEAAKVFVLLRGTASKQARPPCVCMHACM